MPPNGQRYVLEPATAFRPLWRVFLPVNFKLHRSFHTVETFISYCYTDLNYYQDISSFTIFQLTGNEQKP